MSPRNEKGTLPSIPAAIKKFHRPTLLLKTAIEIKEEQEPGRYSLIMPRGN